MLSVYIVVVLCAVFACVYWYWYGVQSAASKKKRSYKDYRTQLITNPTKFRGDYEKSYTVSNLAKNKNFFEGAYRLGAGITIVLDIYISNIPMNAGWGTTYKTSKPIVRVGGSPRLYYLPASNELMIAIDYADFPNYTNQYEVKCPDVKLQRWNKYIFVIDGRNIRIYLNGKIIKSQTRNEGFPIIYNNNIILGKANNNFLGNIRQLDIYPYPVDYLDIPNL